MLLASSLQSEGAVTSAVLVQAGQSTFHLHCRCLTIQTRKTPLAAKVFHSGYRYCLRVLDRGWIPEDHLVFY